MTDVFMFGVARPCRVLLVRPERRSNGVQTFYKISVRSEGLEDLRTDTRHDVHVRDDIRRIRDLNADFGNLRAQWAHTIWDDIHRASPHRRSEKVRKILFHSDRIFPIVRRSGIIFSFGTNEGLVFDASNVNSRGPDINAIRTFLWIQRHGRAAL